MRIFQNICVLFLLEIHAYNYKIICRDILNWANCVKKYVYSVQFASVKHVTSQQNYNAGVWETQIEKNSNFFEKSAWKAERGR